jgi:hypothetical protein
MMNPVDAQLMDAFLSPSDHQAASFTAKLQEFVATPPELHERPMHQVDEQPVNIDHLLVGARRGKDLPFY